MNLKSKQRRETRKELLGYLKKNRRYTDCYKARMVWYFFNHYHWQNKARLAAIFSVPNGFYFAGLDWDRILRQLVVDGWLESEVDPKKDNGTKRYRLTPSR